MNALRTLMKIGMLLAAVALLPAEAGAAATRDPETHFFNPNTGDLRAELADAKKAGKKAVLIMFEQEGCPACIYMKSNVLNRVDVQAFYRKEFFNFSIDTYGAVPIKDFTGRDFTEKGYAQAIGVKGTPTFVLYDLQGKEVMRMVGPVKDPEEFLLLGEFVASGAYQSGKFADYRELKRKRKAN